MIPLKNISVDAEQDLGHLPMIECCTEGNKELLLQLLRSGMDPNERDEKGKTGLHIAAVRGNVEILQILVDHGAELDKPDVLGNTPLHYCGHKEAVQYLVESGADVSACNLHGDIPLTLMKRRGVEAEVIKLMEQFLNTQENSEVEDTSLPLLRMRRRRRNKGWVAIRNIWYEFCVDLGIERLVVVILTILCLSLFVAYKITGLAKQLDTRIPVVDADKFKVEL